MSNERDVRPWGDYEVLLDRDDFKVKRITVKAGKRLSLQKHRQRSEHWFFVSGRGTVVLGESEVEVSAGSAVDIPAGTPHRAAAGKEDLVFVEIQTGDYFGEDDIIRLEDDFGRA